MPQSILETKAKNTILNEINQTLESSPNRDLALAVLYASKHTGLMLPKAHEWLDVPKAEFDETVKHLLESAFIKLDYGNFKLEEDRKKYVRAVTEPGLAEYMRSDLPFGEYWILDKKGADESTALKAMRSLDDSVKWKYTKRFDLGNDVELLEGVYSIVSSKVNITEGLEKYGADVLDRYSVVMGDLPELPSEQKMQEFERRRQGLEKTVSTLTKLKDKQDVGAEDINYSLDFMRDLSKRCLSYEQKTSYRRKNGLVLKI